MSSLRIGVATAVAVLTACLASALPQLETVFSISMPYAETTFGGSPGGSPAAFLFHDAVYVIASGENTIEAVNLTTKQVMWVAPNISNSGYSITAVAATSEAVLVGFPGTIIALSPTTGSQMWTTSGYGLMQPGIAYSYGGWIYARSILPPDPQGYEYYALQSFNAATGAPGAFLYSNYMLIDGTTAFFNNYSVVGTQIVNDMLMALDIPTNTTLWSLPYPVESFGPIIKAFDETRILVGNYSGPDEIGVVLDRKTGAVLHQFQAFNGLGVNSQNSPPALYGNYLFALIGEDYARYVLIDLTTGFTIWTRGVEDIGYGAVFVDGAVVAVSQALVLSVTPTSGSTTVSVPHVPTLPTASISAFGGLLQVGNLQGYTLWDSATGTLLGRNEQSPYATGSNSMVWNGITVTVTGNVVVGSKVVR